MRPNWRNILAIAIAIALCIGACALGYDTDPGPAPIDAGGPGDASGGLLGGVDGFNVTAFLAFLFALLEFLFG